MCVIYHPQDIVDGCLRIVIVCSHGRRPTDRSALQ